MIFLPCPFGVATERVSSWGRVAVVVTTGVLAAGRLDRGRAVRVRPAAGRAVLAEERTARRAGLRCWRARPGVAAQAGPVGRRRTGVRRRRGRRRPGPRAAGRRATRRRLRRA